MFITFLVSSIFHEVVMSCITKKLRGYGFGAMMLQLPIVAVQKSRFFKGKKTLNVSHFQYKKEKHSPSLYSRGSTSDRSILIECLFLVLYDFGSFHGKCQ